MKIAIYYTDKELKEMDISAHLLRESVIENIKELDLPPHEVIMMDTTKRN